MNEVFSKPVAASASGAVGPLDWRILQDGAWWAALGAAAAEKERHRATARATLLKPVTITHNCSLALAQPWRGTSDF